MPRLQRTWLPEVYEHLAEQTPQQRLAVVNRI